MPHGGFGGHGIASQFIQSRPEDSPLARFFPKIHALGQDDILGRNIPKPIPRTAGNPRGLDPQVASLEREGAQHIRDQEQAQQDLLTGQREQARTDFEGIQSSFDEALAGILETTRDPFTDELRQSLEGEAFSNINTQVNRMSQDLGASRRGRGFQSGGGSGVGSATDVGLEEIRLRQTTSNTLGREQRDVNQRQDQFIANVQAGLTVAEAGTLAGMSRVEGTLALGQAGLIDPTQLPNFLEDALSASFGIEQARELTDIMREALEADDMEGFQRAMAGISALSEGFFDRSKIAAGADAASIFLG